MQEQNGSVEERLDALRRQVDKIIAALEQQVQLNRTHTERILTFPVGDRPQHYSLAIMCHRCGLVSLNPNDVANRYCGNCHLFLEDQPHA